MTNALSAASAQQCEVNTTEYVIQKPCVGSNVMVEISKDEPTALNFAVDDVRAMKLLTDGALLLTFTDGSTLTLTNFKAARETFKFQEMTMSDGTTVNFDKLAAGLASTMPHDTVADLTIMKPQGGMDATDLQFALQQGKTYSLGFDMKEVAAVEHKGEDLYITFKDGSHLTLQNYDSVQVGALPPAMTLADGSVVPVSQLINVLNVAAADAVKTVEPAAGETQADKAAENVIAIKAAAQEVAEQIATAKLTAEQLAEIEPAAGTGPIGGTAGGYGFNSSVDAASINALAAVGPIGITDLAFRLPELQQFNSAFVPVAPASTPTLNAVDRFGFEDTEINLLISATGANPANETLTLTITGIPAGWDVNIASSGGTYNAATGTWTITLPQGSTFSGGPYLIPPHDFDGDIKQPTNPPLNVTMTTTDTTGVVTTVSTTMNVTVDAVADQPDLAVNNVSGSDNDPLPLQISAHVVDTDGSEKLTTVTLTGIPTGFTLNHGTFAGGVWTVNPADLPTLSLTPPRGYQGSFVVTVRVNNEEATLTDSEITLSNNTNFNEESFQVTINDTAPIVGDSTASVDDTNLSGGVNTVSGNIAINYQLDTPGTFTPVNNFNAGGSLLGNTLSSNGNAVSVVLNGNTYTGTANGVKVFTLVVNANGSYNFSQFEQLDHADNTQSNEVITLNFTVQATDFDGDTDTGTITIQVLDDAPLAVNDTFATSNVATGNVTSNDTLSQDTPNLVTQILYNGTTYTVPANGNLTINGTYGALVINKAGVYTYTSNNTGTGNDTFTYTLRDFDGDTSTATLTAHVDHINGVPTITGSNVTTDDTNLAGGPQTVNGTYTFNYGGDGQGATGTISVTGYNGPALTSKGAAVTLAMTGNTIIGSANGGEVFRLTVGTDGTYSFKQSKVLDHPDATNPDDALNLAFGIRITDANGDAANASITAVVRDDGPVAVNDTFLSATATATGNIMANDNVGQDTPGHIAEITYNGTTYTLPANGSQSVTDATGTLKVFTNGDFTYTPAVPGTGTTFTYKLVDFDGDKSVVDANHGTVVIDTNGVPTITGSSVTTDDTDLGAGPQTVNGTYTFGFGGDGQGAGGITNTGYTGPALTSNGNAVSVTLAGNTYTGTANGVTIFTMTINTDGTYSFTQREQLDHPNANDPNDALNLTFGLRITDANGDVAAANITAVVRDDGPVAINDSFLSTGATATGNITANDIIGQDTPGRVFDVTFGGTTQTLPANGTNVTITNASGTLVINSTGQFTYTPPVPGQNATFTYHLIDFDGDKSVVDANHGTVVIDTDGKPTITGSSVTTDDTNLGAGPQTVAGTYTFGFGGDGQGAGGITNTGYTGPALTSNGNAVTVTLAGNTYTGTANGVTVFTMTVNSNGTYSFTQNEQLDHPNANDPNDALNLTFGIRITDANGDVANAALTAVVRDDGPVAVNDSFLSSTATASGNIMANDNVGQDTPGRVFDVTFGGTTQALPADGTNVTITNASGTLVINTTGQFTFTPPLPGQGATFTYHLIDFDGDKSVVDAQHGTVTIDTDGQPIIGDSTVVTDETSLVIGASVTNGAVSKEFFGDGPGTITALNNFTSDGSKLNGALTSHGVAVNVALAGNTYTGTAGGTTVFTMTVNSDGSFTFKQFEQLDHANANDPNDIITLNFGVRGTDADGDTDDGKITVNVRDDAPSALDDTINMPTGTTTATGNVLTNDTAGQDTPVPVLSVSYNGTAHTLPTNGTNVTIVAAHGTLVINNTGAYTYTSTNASTGSDVFNYTIRDYDGDTSSAKLTVSVTDIDTVPVVDNSAITVDETNLGPIALSGQVSANYFADGPGSIAAVNSFNAGGSLLNNALTSHGVAVGVTLTGSTYTGMAGGTKVFTLLVNSNGSYTYTQFEQLDHADGSNANDIITLNFTVRGTDADGDTDTGVITVNVLDDAPVAVNDTLSVSTVTPATGNVLTNDNPGQDTPITLTQVVFNGATFAVPTNGNNVTIAGNHGTLVINNTGSYTYTSNNTTTGSDVFSYTIKDFDKDPSTATFTATVTDVDTTPVVTNTTTTIDESSSHTVTGTITADFFGDGFGAYITCGAFNASGSLKNGALTSSGVAVTITNTGHGYVGTAGGATVFSLDINQTTGAYTFTQFKPLDHADALNPNDVIKLSFEVCARDGDGDVGHGTLTVNVVDDAPVAANDSTIYCITDSIHNGNLITGLHNTGSGGIDTVSFDTPNWIFSVTGTGGTAFIPSNGVASVDGQFGTLYVFNNGSYFYNQKVDGQHTETFTYHMQDGDGDTSAGSLVISGVSSYINDSWIVVNGSATGSSGGDVMVAYTNGVSDTMFGGAGDDAMFGWSGNDNLHGGAGNDALFGEYGADNLWGDAGADIFVAERSDMDGGYQGKFYDTVKDFNAAEGDVLDLASLIDNGSAAQAAINNYVRALNQGTGTMLQVNNGAGWKDAMFIENHTNVDVQTLLHNGNLDVT